MGEHSYLLDQLRAELSDLAARTADALSNPGSRRRR
jgi:hypothetical protein